MTNKNESDGPSYVQKVGEGTLRYAQELLAENEKLRFVVASLRNERLQLVEKIQLTDYLVEEHDSMRHVVTALMEEKLRLQEELLALRERQARHAQDREQLQRQLAEIETQNQRFSEEYVEVERQNNNLMNLYVASYRLHGTLDRREVLGTIQEIVANLVGCEEHGIFELDPASGALRLVASVGIDPAAYEVVPLGHGVIGRAAVAGETYVAGSAPDAAAGTADGGITACIPLKLDGRVTGAIALFRLLPQKPALEEVDHELFDLLATHAATALYCTKLHTASDTGNAAGL